MPRQVRSRDPGLGLLAQAGGQSVVEYLASKYSAVQAARGPEGQGRPRAVELGPASAAWGRRERTELAWDRARDGGREDRRTPVPVPDEAEEEDAVRIVRSKHSDRRQRVMEERGREAEEVGRLASQLREARDEAAASDLRSYNAFLPAGVLAVPAGGSVTALLKVPGLKPRVAELVGRRVELQPREELAARLK